MTLSGLIQRPLCEPSVERQICTVTVPGRLHSPATDAFHLADLPRFRLLYLSPQVGVTTVACKAAAELVRQIHPVTAEMYAAVAAALGDGPGARETAVALHMAALGHILMVALTDAIGDPLRHEPKILAARLAEVLAAGVGYHSEIMS